MKKALGLIVAAVIAVGAYRYVSSNSAEATYKRFAEEMLHRRYETAAGMAEGLNAADLAKLGTQERIGGGPPMFQTLFPSRFNIESSERAPDGSITLHATQTVLFNPAGVESAVRPAMFARMRQVATLRKKAGEWRIAAFSNTFETMDEVRAR